MIENSKLFFFFFGCVYVYNLSNKKRVYIIKKRAYVYIYVRESCLDKYISIAFGPPRQKFLAPPLTMAESMQRREGKHAERKWIF